MTINWTLIAVGVGLSALAICLPWIWRRLAPRMARAFLQLVSGLDGNARVTLGVVRKLLALSLIVSPLVAIRLSAGLDPVSAQRRSWAAFVVGYALLAVGYAGVVGIQALENVDPAANRSPWGRHGPRWAVTAILIAIFLPWLVAGLLPTHEGGDELSSLAWVFILIGLVMAVVGPVQIIRIRRASQRRREEAAGSKATQRRPRKL